MNVFLVISQLVMAYSSVTLKPGDNIQQIVDGNAPGTKYTFAPGVYRNQQISPKDGDVFIGKKGAVLNGAKLLTAFQREGVYWVVTGQTQEGFGRGVCQKAFPRCQVPHDLFFDDVPLTHVAELQDVASDSWYFDLDADKIYFADDPTGRVVETGVMPVAFKNSADNVTIEGLTIEKYATRAQVGAIHGHDTSGWIVRRSEIRLNHGTGVRMGANWTVEDNHIHTNGQLGIGGGRLDGSQVIANEISFNNYAHYGVGWEAGGGKFLLTKGLLLKRNYVHNNQGWGLWCDHDNEKVIYEQNILVDNLAAGIHHEISHGAIIRHNVARGNGLGPRWIRGAQILIANSSNSDVYGNHLVVSAEGGQGITLVQQDRNEFKTRGNYVHHNTIKYSGKKGLSGGSATDDVETFVNGNNRFDHNTYCTPYLDNAHWEWMGHKTWTQFQALGHETNGMIFINSSTKCDTANEIKSLSNLNSSERSVR